MASEDIVVTIKTLAQVKELIQYSQNLEKLARVGVYVDKGFRDIYGRFMSFNEVVKRGSIVFRGFRMEMLSILFFGMGIQRMFQSWLKPSMDLIGAFQVWSMALGVLFLPLAQQVLEWGIKFLEWVQSLDPYTQGLINAFAAIGFAIGTLLLGFGTLYLGLVGVSTVFGISMAALLPFIGTFALVGLAVLGFVALLANWNTMSKKVKAILKLVLDQFVPLSPAIDIVTTAFAGLKDTLALIKENGFVGFVNGIIGALNKLINKLNSFFEIYNSFAGRVGLPKIAIPNIPELKAESSNELNFTPTRNYTPANQNFSPNISVNVSTTGGVDGKSLARQVIDEMNSTYANQLSSIARR